MKLITPDIVYHDMDPIYTCDIQSKSEDFIRLATGGFDCAVRLWKLNCNDISNKDNRPVDLVATLNRHEKRVNVVRWSPSGNILASASDDGVIVLWQKSIEISPKKTENDDEANLETWTPKCLRRHFQDVYDLCWSMNENHLISGSIDCCAILWNLKNPNKVIILKDHKQFVQGVAWDPLDNVVITQSSDRTMRIYRASTRTCIYKVWKSGDMKLFQDGSWKYFFRRLEFSPDGKLLVTPAGLYDMKKKVEETNDIYAPISGTDNHAAHIFVRHNLSKVAVTIPTGKHAVIGVRFNPVRFTLHNKSPESVFKLPYRWVFCLILDDGVLVYDTEQCVPIVRIFNIHCLSITDASWSPDGHCLVVSSTDGFCSYVYFDHGELGDVYTLVSKPSMCNAPLRNIDNIVGSANDREQHITTSTPNNLSVLELDPTQILQAAPATDDNDDSSSDTDICSIDNECMQIDGEILVENVPIAKKPMNFNSPNLHRRSVGKRVTGARDRSDEPDTKKRRITLTMLPLD